MGSTCSIDDSQKSKGNYRKSKSHNATIKLNINEDNESNANQKGNGKLPKEFKPIESIEEKKQSKDEKILKKRSSKINKEFKSKNKIKKDNNKKIDNNDIKDINHSDIKEQNKNSQVNKSRNENNNNNLIKNKEEKNMKINKSYEDLNNNLYYYLICPDCGSKTPTIQNFIFDDNKNDFIIYYNCECNGLQKNIKNASLFNFISINRPSIQNSDIISKENKEKFTKILTEKKDTFKGFNIVNKLIDSLPLNVSVAPPPNIFKSSSMVKKSNVKESDVHIEYSQNYVQSVLPEIKEEEKEIYRNYECIKTLTGHTEKISSLIQLESGLIATGAYDQKIMILDLEKSIKINEIQENGVVFCLLEFDPNFLLSGNDQNEINLWDISSNKKERIFNFSKHDLWVNCLVKCSLQFFASASNDKTIRIYNFYEREEVRVLEGHEDGILSLILLKNGNLCSGSADLFIKIWNWNSGECIYTIPGHQKWVKCLCELEDDILLSGSDDNTIKLWKNYNEIKTLTDHQNSVRALCKIDRKYFASGSFDNTIKIWEIENLKCVDTLIGHKSNVTGLIKIKENTLVSCSCDKTIKVWEKINLN